MDSLLLLTIYDVMLLAFLALGILGTMLPVIPGPALIVVGALLYGLFTDFLPISLVDIAILAVLALVAVGGQYLLTMLGAKSFGASGAGMVGAVIGLFLGLVLPIPGSAIFGMLLGTFVGAVGGELWRDRQKEKVLKAGLGAVLGTVVSFIFEMAVTAAMVIFVVVELVTR
ncbi:MAG: DUF456 domain-containing protein [Thermodesulfobacteriota bacterium]